MAWRQQRDLNLRPLLDQVALHLQVDVAADQGQRRIELQGLHEHQHYVFPRADGIGMALHVSCLKRRAMFVAVTSMPPQSRGLQLSGRP